MSAGIAFAAAQKVSARLSMGEFLRPIDDDIYLSRCPFALWLLDTEEMLSIRRGRVVMTSRGAREQKQRARRAGDEFGTRRNRHAVHSGVSVAIKQLSAVRRPRWLVPASGGNLPF